MSPADPVMMSFISSSKSLIEMVSRARSHHQTLSLGQPLGQPWLADQWPPWHAALCLQHKRNETSQLRPEVRGSPASSGESRAQEDRLAPGDTPPLQAGDRPAKQPSLDSRWDWTPACASLHFCPASRYQSPTVCCPGVSALFCVISTLAAAL